MGTGTAQQHPESQIPVPGRLPAHRASVSPCRAALPGDSVRMGTPGKPDATSTGGGQAERWHCSAPAWAKRDFITRKEQQRGFGARPWGRDAEFAQNQLGKRLASSPCASRVPGGVPTELELAAPPVQPTRPADPWCSRDVPASRASTERAEFWGGGGWGRSHQLSITCWCHARRALVGCCRVSGRLGGHGRADRAWHQAGGWPKFPPRATGL